MRGVWRLRRTNAGDEDFLWEMLFYASHSNDEPGVTLAHVRSDPELIVYIEGWREDLMGVVAESEPGKVGAAWLRMLDQGERSNPVFVDPAIPELAIAVLPGMEGNGIGTALICDLMNRARGRYPAIVLSSRLENPAVHLYERLGYRIVEEITNRVGTRSVKMLAEL